MMMRMIMKLTTRFGLFILGAIGVASLGGCAISAPAGPRLASDDFTRGLAQWQIELEQPGSVRMVESALDIDVPAGATLWFKPEITGPVAITFDATAISAGGPNDRVSDLNVFWMARNKDGSAPFSQARSGAFADYNDLLTYYVGLGGNTNTTTRFRRYIGDPVTRPLLPEHDLSSSDVLLVPNRLQQITLIAAGSHIEYWRDGVKLLSYEDPRPYTRGWFAIRTVKSHLKIDNLVVRRINPARP